MKKWLLLGLVFLLICIFLPLGASAANTNVTGNVVEQLDVEINGSISNWNMAVGDNYNTNVSMVINSTGDWQASVQDAMDSSKPSIMAGRMGNWTGTAWAAGNLTFPLEVKPASGSYLNLTSTSLLLDSGTPENMYNDALTFWEHIQYGDVQLKSGVYRIMVQFTGTMM
jgi:hypothetical protein